MMYEKVVSLLLSGMKAYEVANLCDLTLDSVYRIRKKATACGVLFPKLKRTPSLSNEQVEEIIERHKRGECSSYIARYMNTNPNSVNFAIMLHKKREEEKNRLMQDNGFSARINLEKTIGKVSQRTEDAVNKLISEGHDITTRGSAIYLDGTITTPLFLIKQAFSSEKGRF